MLRQVYQGIPGCPRPWVRIHDSPMVKVLQAMDHIIGHELELMHHHGPSFAPWMMATHEIKCLTSMIMHENPSEMAIRRTTDRLSINEQPNM